MLSVSCSFSWAATLVTAGSTCKEISVKPYYPSALTPSPHPPSLNNLPIHVVWLPGLLLCHLSSGLCFSEALQDIGLGATLPALDGEGDFPGDAVAGKGLIL